jgi:site-specific DNA-methyltransferase (adenine-specific)
MKPYWKNESLHLWHSDFRELTLLEKVGCVVTSPPYNIGKDYDTHDDVLPEDEYYTLIRSLSEWCWSNTSPENAHVFLNVGHTCVDPLIAFNVLKAFMANEQWHLQNRIIWVKSLHVQDKTYGHFKPVNSKRFLNDCFEEVFHLTKTGAEQIDRLRTGVPYEDKSNESRWEGAGKLRCRGNVWFVPYETITSKSMRGNHPAPFPVELAEMCIKLSGAKSVADPMVGTGSTMVAAKRLGVRGYGADISKDYLDFAVNRLANEELRLSIL